MFSPPDDNDYDLDRYGDPREFQQDEDDSAEDALESESRSKPDFDDPTEEQDKLDGDFDTDPYYFMGER